VPMRQISSEALVRALAMRGMSQAMLARSLKVDRSTINRWINGVRPIGQRYRPMLWELLGAALQEV
jgi:plasmid maintenance system antidote protein VapI